MKYSIERTLDYFEKGQDELTGQILLRDVTLAFLQSLFGVDGDDPMYEVFPAGPEHLEALRPYVSGPIDPGRYDYYLDCSGTPIPEAETAGSEIESNPASLQR